MVYVGIDPSFKRTGIVVLDGNKITITRCETEPNSNKSFIQVWNDAVNQANVVVATIESLIKASKEIEVISECPPPQGMFSPGLYALDSLLFNRLRGRVNHVYVVYPNYLGHVHGKRNYKKSESLELASKMMSSLARKVDFDIKSKRMSHDEAEAFIFLMRLCVKNNMWRIELQTFDGLFSDNEKLLF